MLVLKGRHREDGQAVLACERLGIGRTLARVARHLMQTRAEVAREASGGVGVARARTRRGKMLLLLTSSASR